MNRIEQRVTAKPVAAGPALAAQPADDLNVYKIRRSAGVIGCTPEHFAET